MVREHIIHKTKKLSCGHEQTFSTPVPQPGDNVVCITCDRASTIPRRTPQPWTVATGRRRRLKSNPRSNNQYTKGRSLGMERKEVQLGGCLLLAKLNFPSQSVYKCGLCPNRSDTVGDLAENCTAPKSSVQG